MSYHVYILWSSTLGEYYTGFSLFSRKRLRQHRQGESCWTSRADDWETVWSEQVATRAAARELEKRIKGRGAKRFLSDASRGVAAPPQAG